MVKFKRCFTLSSLLLALVLAVFSGAASAAVMIVNGGPKSGGQLYEGIALADLAANSDLPGKTPFLEDFLSVTNTAIPQSHSDSRTVIATSGFAAGGTIDMSVTLSPSGVVTFASTSSASGFASGGTGYTQIATALGSSGMGYTFSLDGAYQYTFMGQLTSWNSGGTVNLDGQLQPNAGLFALIGNNDIGETLFDGQPSFNQSGLLGPGTYYFDAGVFALGLSSDALLSTSVAAGTFSLTLTPAAVPLPAAVWLFGSGLLGLIGVARRKRTA